MTTFDNRENAFENKFAHDADLQFKVTARRNKLVGHWAAELMGLTAEEADAYGKSVVQADFEEAGDEDVVRKLLGDLTSAGVETDDAAIRTALDAKMVEARRQFIEQAWTIMGMAAEEIEGMIKAAFPDALVEIIDLAGDNNHFAARVVSSAFVGMSRVKQHKAVYDALEGKMGGVLHALQLTTAVPV